MTHTIELSPDLEKRIEAQALRRGVPIEKYLREVIETWTREAEPAEEGDQNALAVQFSSDAKTRNAQIRALLTAPAEVRDATMRAAAIAAAAWYATPEGSAELADWRALDGEDFHGFEAEDAEASLAAERAA